MTLFKSIFATKKFSPFFWVLFLGAFNDNVIKNVLIIMIAYKGIELYGMGPGVLIAFVGALFILPFMVFSPYAGTLADKYNKVKILRAVKVIELFIMILAGAGFFLQNYTLLIFTLFLMGTQSTFFGPVKYSIPPELVKTKDISNATAYVEMGTFLAILLGTILGGYLSSVDSATLIGLILVSVSVLGIVFGYMQPLTSAKTDSNIKLGCNVFGGHIKLFKVILIQRNVFFATVLISMFWFLGAGLLTLLPTYCKDVINVSESVVTLFLAMFTVGIAVGSLVGGKVSNDKILMKLVPIGAVGILIFAMDFYYVNSGWVSSDVPLRFKEFLAVSGAKRSLLDFFFISFFGGLFILPLYAYLQVHSKKGTLSRVIAANNILNSLFMVAVSVIIMVFVSNNYTSVESILYLSGIFFVLSILIFFLVPAFRKGSRS